MRVAAILVLLLSVTPPAEAWSDRPWVVNAQSSKQERYLGREALTLQNGTAWLDDAAFLNGTIEFDLAVPNEPGFHGVAFRARDHENYEHVYIRSHLSGKPDATQYTPVFNGVSGWQIYTGPRYALPVTIPPDRWVHVRIVVEGARLELSIDGETLVFPELQRNPTPGGVALTSSLVAARFANVRISSKTTFNADGRAGAELIPPGPATITEWRISTPFAESRVESNDTIDREQWSDLQWKTLASGGNGIANLAMLRRRTSEQNTVFAAVTLRAREAVFLAARFGFSDRVVVFLNGRPLYRGNDKYLSRDYRFLGSVGLFDEVILPLEKGDNEVWLAVSEDFGGWGVILQLTDAGAGKVEVTK